MNKLIATLTYTFSALIITTATLGSNPGYAETVNVPVGQQGNISSVATPKRGITKAQVKAQLGEPNGWRPAVGQPPISSWVYDSFTVYFEYDRVIHSVLTR